MVAINAKYSPITEFHERVQESLQWHKLTVTSALVTYDGSDMAITKLSVVVRLIVVTWHIHVWYNFLTQFDTLASVQN